MTSENEVFYISEILKDDYSSCSMLKIFPKYLNFENISKKCIRVPGPLERHDEFIRETTLYGDNKFHLSCNNNKSITLTRDKLLASSCYAWHRELVFV